MAVRLGIGLNVRFEMEALAPQKALALAGVAQMLASPMAVAAGGNGAGAYVIHIGDLMQQGSNGRWVGLA